MKELKQFAFADCVLVEEIVFPESVEKVGPSAFEGCTSLKKIVIKNPKTKFSTTAFEGCTALDGVSYDILKLLPLDLQCKIVIKRLQQFSDLSQEQQEELVAYLKKKAVLRKEIFLSGDVGAISTLLEQKIKLSLEMVEEFLANSISKKETEVTAIFLDYKNKNFAKKVQEDYNANKELVEIGLELPTLKQFKAKWKCSKVEGGLSVSEYKGSETHETIPAQLAEGTKIVALQKIVSGKGKPIPTGSLKHLTIEAPITSLTQNAFHASELESIILPDTMETIGNFAFTYCEKLKNIVFPPNLKILPDTVCGACYSLEEVTLPENLEEIGANAFLNCRQLKIVHFPNHQVDVGESAFAGTPSLHEVTLPRGVKLEEKAFDAKVTINWK